MQCPKCQIAWLDPQPIADDIGKIYTNYFTHQAPDNTNRFRGLRKAVKASILNSRYGYQMEGSNKVMGSFLSCIGPLREMVGGSVRWLDAREGGRLLDVGCGNGSFLDKMRHLGWEVAGVEPDGEAVAVARKRFGLEIFKGSLDEAGFSDESFDAITMNHVIEHVPDPIELLKECRRVLKPGGRLWVATPNIKSLGHYKFGEHWRGLEVPRHLTLFSPGALQSCAESAGLAARVCTSDRSAPWMYAASSLIRRDGALPGGSPRRTTPWLRMQGRAFLAREHGLFGPRDAGEEIVMVAGR